MELQLIPNQVTSFFFVDRIVFIHVVVLGLEETCHVLKDTKNGGIFTAVLGLVDITRGTNSYYKMQLLESDDQKKWFIFRA